MWRGQPLAGVKSDVLVREVPRLAEIQLSLFELRLDAEIRLGRAADAVSELHRLCAAHPLREHLHALLMLALHGCGRRAEALAAYQAARRVLLEELGSEPATRLQELHQQVLAGAVPEPPAALARADSGPGAARQQASDGQPTPDGTAGALPRQLPAPVRHFTDRQPELAALSALLDCVANTAMRIMSVRYPADLVRAPLSPEYDLRTLFPVTLTDRQHETATAIFNRHAASSADFAEADVPELEPLDWADQMQVFQALFFMFGSKLEALKYSTGIE